jgi:hypothetical protein
MLRSREYQTLGGFPGFREVMDRMDGNTKGENTQSEYEAKRRRAAPAPHALSHGNRCEHEEDAGQGRPGHRW